MTPRSPRPVAAPSQRAVIDATRPVRARPVRFRLSVHSPRDQAIARWLDGLPAYSRAEAMRCALYDHLQGQTMSPSADTSSRPASSSTPPAPSPSAAGEPPAVTKMRRMF